MCSGDYLRDAEFAEKFGKGRFVRSKAVYFLRGRYRRIGGKNCVYCGFRSDTGDHVPPLLEGYQNGIVNGVVVSTCYDCNKFLGSYSSTCLRDRAKFLSERYKEELVRLKVDRFAEKSPGSKDGLDVESAYTLKAQRCEQRIDAINCDMLNGSAALFKANGEAGGETTRYESISL
jgi:hypothetical protein